MPTVRMLNFFVCTNTENYVFSKKRLATAPNIEYKTSLYINVYIGMLFLFLYG